VTAPIGEDRHSLLLSYVADPANIVSYEKAVRIWGEAHPLHSEGSGRHQESGVRSSS
jgi:hypothetical protein